MVFGNFNLLKSNRGQLSVEFILIVLVVFILIETIILPLRDYSEGSVKDMTTVSYLEQDLSKITSAINDLNYYSAGEITVNLHIPDDANMFISPSSAFDVNIFYVLKSNSTDLNTYCPNNLCTKSLSIKNVRVGKTLNLYSGNDYNLLVGKNVEGYLEIFEKRRYYD